MLCVGTTPGSAVRAVTASTRSTPESRSNAASSPVRPVRPLLARQPGSDHRASLLRPRVFWPSRAWQREPAAARFAAIGRALGRRPALFAIVSGLVLVVLAIGALGYKPT